MKILIVHSGNKNADSPYIREQVESLERLGLRVEYFTIKKSGAFGYVSHLPSYLKKVSEFKPDIVHAHFGLSGLFANLQRKAPVITSFHGTDIHKKKNVLFSKAAYLLSKDSIFVSNNLRNTFNVKGGQILTCGVDLNLFKPIPDLKKEKFLLFGGRAGKAVKNYSLAKKSVDYFNEFIATEDQQLELIELNNKTREEVMLLMNKTQGLLITSHYEGSSQVLKEAMACNCPVIAVDVGSVSDLIGENSKSGVIVGRNEKEIAESILKVYTGNYKYGREELLRNEISLDQIALQLVSIYEKALKQ